MSATSPSDPHRAGVAHWVRTSRHTASLTVDNPGDMTLEGTNTYVVGELGDLGLHESAGSEAPGHDPADAVRAARPRVVVVDPGPADEAHARAIAEAVDVAAILLSHRHADHAGNARALHELTGAPVRAWRADLCIDAPPLQDGEVVSTVAPEIFVLHTPGHTADSVCLRVEEDAVMLTGDTILGRGTTMLDYPDGDLEDYIDTLRELLEENEHVVLPAHGPAGGDLHRLCEELLDHRLTRIHELRRRLKAEEDDIAPSASRLVEIMYAHVPPGAQTSALKTLKAQLAYLVDIGEIAGFTD